MHMGQYGFNAVARGPLKGYGIWSSMVLKHDHQSLLVTRLQWFPLRVGSESENDTVNVAWVFPMTSIPQVSLWRAPKTLLVTFEGCTSWCHRGCEAYISLYSPCW